MSMMSIPQEIILLANDRDDARSSEENNISEQERERKKRNCQSSKWLRVKYNERLEKLIKVYLEESGRHTKLKCLVHKEKKHLQKWITIANFLKSVSPSFNYQLNINHSLLHQVLETSSPSLCTTSRKQLSTSNQTTDKKHCRHVQQSSIDITQGGGTNQLVTCSHSDMSKTTSAPETLMNTPELEINKLALDAFQAKNNPELQADDVQHRDVDGLSSNQYAPVTETALSVMRSSPYICSNTQNPVTPCYAPTVPFGMSALEELDALKHLADTNTKNAESVDLAQTSSSENESKTVSYPSAPQCQVLESDVMTTGKELMHGQNLKPVLPQTWDTASQDSSTLPKDRNYVLEAEKQPSTPAAQLLIPDLDALIPTQVENDIDGGSSKCATRYRNAYTCKKQRLRNSQTNRRQSAKATSKHDGLTMPEGQMENVFMSSGMAPRNTLHQPVNMANQYFQAPEAAKAIEDIKAKLLQGTTASMFS